MGAEVKTYKKTATIDALEWDGSMESTAKIVDWAAAFGSEVFLTRLMGEAKTYQEV